MTVRNGYYVCAYAGPQWWYCYGMLDNGFCFGQHVCSDPGFAPGDLLQGRRGRKLALAAVFPELPDVEFSTVEVRGKADLPPWWESLANSKEVQAELKPFYDKYAKELEAQKEPDLA